VTLLLARERVDVNSKNKAGQTPLLRAAHCGHEAVVMLLKMHIRKRRKEIGGGSTEEEATQFSSRANLVLTIF
jgi:hypothetical protein